MTKETSQVIYLISLFFFFVSLFYAIFYKFQVGKAENMIGITLSQSIKVFLIISVLLPIASTLIVLFFLVFQ